MDGTSGAGLTKDAGKLRDVSRRDVDVPCNLLQVLASSCPDHEGVY